MKILGIIANFMIEALRTIMLICFLPIIWFMQFLRWLKEKIIGDL